MDSFVILAILLSIPMSVISVVLLQKMGGMPKDWKTSIGVFFTIVCVSSLLSLSIGEGSKYISMMDVEIISGQITSKERKHGHYQRSYECFCTTDSKGNRSCRTCYEDRYTVKWKADSTLGSYTIKSLDESSKRVYNTPDPQRYTTINVGDPVADEHRYKNYMKGIPDEYSFNKNLGGNQELLAKIPAYPRVFDFYMVNRVINLDGVLKATQEVEYNKLIANKLRTLGPQKEVNIILIAGKQDENLVYAVREKWDGVKKNDVVVVLGLEGSEIKTVNVLTWAKNELFKIRLQDRIDEHKAIDGVLEIVFNEVEHSFVRPKMRDYEDMKMYMQTPMWALITIFILLFGFPVIIVLFNKFKR